MISIIMPTYNRASVISIAIESVLNQTYQDFELIIIDDGSTDETPQIINTFTDKRIRFIHNIENRGANYARNIGIKEANGKYLAFLDSDNSFYQDYLQHRIELIENITTPVISFGQMIMKFMDSSSCIWPQINAELLRDRVELQKIMLKENQIDTNTVILSRDIQELQSGFDEKMQRLQDWEFFFRIIRNDNNTIIYDDQISIVHNELSDCIGKKDELLWPSRLFIFEKNKDLAEKYEYKENVIQSMAKLHLNKIEATAGLFHTYANASEEIKTVIEAIVINAIKEEQDTSLKYKEFYYVLTKWIRNNNNGASLSNYFIERGIRKIAIYGMKELGQQLLEDLKGTDVKVLYAIDQNPSLIINHIKIVSPKDISEPVDAIIITAIHYYKDICSSLVTDFDCQIISLMDIVTEIEKETLCIDNKGVF
ncbi:MAG: glycosyltransferase [Lachnospiraceae bacterium]|nr:glycosyltransferase [Lachnospiraceae bacterium]